ncbi:hypothetical protein [Thermoactinospora rubra]|uniref:hypothetical protein n=1 Tax=Thermoactinospora rubra TaxID=1088767 RepID=UPI000A11CF4D|nr:hypothetical protein [Thermoactinospora rubra]
MPEHPLAAVYILGVYASLALVGIPLTLRPWTVDLLAREARVSRRTFVVVVAVAYTMLWPITWTIALAMLLAERKDRDG